MDMRVLINAAWAVNKLQTVVVEDGEATGVVECEAGPEGGRGNRLKKKGAGSILVAALTAAI